MIMKLKKQRPAPKGAIEPVKKKEKKYTAKTAWRKLYNEEFRKL
jgi:hypothetical protein